jgi:hypothetical protein
LAQLLPFYSFDSGVFINGRRDIFIPTSFPGLWRQIEEMIALGQVRAVDEVKREVARHDDETANWAKAQRGLFVSLTRDVQEATSSVLEKHPKLISLGSNKNSADPFVVGLAMAHVGSDGGALDDAASVCRRAGLDFRAGVSHAAPLRGNRAAGMSGAWRDARCHARVHSVLVRPRVPAS